jgi:hypothetical protein
VLVDQQAVVRRVDQLAASQQWREDRRAAWVAILRRLVYGMDWQTGLVTGVTAAQLAAAGARAHRTVSDVIRWAKDAGLLVVIEQGASAAFLGSRRNRTPTYAFVSPAADQQRTGLCDLPQSYVGKKPLLAERPKKTHNDPWPAWRIPETPSERRRAASALLTRIGLDHRLPRQRVYGLLRRWWKDGWCTAGLLYAIDHHPDTGNALGDALRGARDPLRTLGARLATWHQRLDALPSHLHGLRGDYQAAQARQLAARTADHDCGAKPPDRRRDDVQPASPQQRAAARALFAAHRAERKHARMGSMPRSCISKHSR